MKKKIIFIIILVIIIVILFLIPKDTYSKIFGKDSDNALNNEVLSENVLVYMCDESNNLVGVNAGVEALEEDLISQKFDILTMKTGTFKQEYETCINTLTSLIDYERNEDVLVLNLSNESFSSSLTLENISFNASSNEYLNSAAKS